MWLARIFRRKTFDVKIIAVVGIVESHRPHLVGIPFLNTLYAFFIMVVGIRVGKAEGTVLQEQQDFVVVVELAQIHAPLFVVDASHIRVVPNLASAKRRMAAALQRDAVYRLLCQQVAFRRSAFDGNLREVLLEEDILFATGRVGVEGNLDHFGFTVGVGRKIHHLRACCALCKVILFVACASRHVETFDVIRSVATVTVYGVVGGAVVVLLEHLCPYHLFPHKELVGHLHHLVFTILVEEDNIVDIRTVTYKLILLQTHADKSFRTVNVQFLVCFHHLGSLNGIEVADFRLAGMFVTVFLQDIGIPTDGHLREVCQILFQYSQLITDARHEFVGLILIIFEDALHLDFQQTENIVARHFAYKRGLVFGQFAVDESYHRILVGRLFKSLLLIDTLFDEDTFQTGEEQLL